VLPAGSGTDRISDTMDIKGHTTLQILDRAQKGNTELYGEFMKRKYNFLNVDLLRLMTELDSHGMCSIQCIRM
jgi:hypothetical protein